MTSWSLWPLHGAMKDEYTADAASQFGPSCDWLSFKIKKAGQDVLTDWAVGHVHFGHTHPGAHSSILH